MASTIRSRAAVLREVGRPLTIEEIDVGPVLAGDVLVRIRATSLCHTDLEVIDGQLRAPLPMVLGHEAAGTVAAIGSNVQGLAVGDPVTLHWNPHCGRCFHCDRGEPILCEPFLRRGPRGAHFDGHHRLSCAGVPIHTLMYLGSFAEYCVVPAQSAVKMPAALPFDRACLLGCGVMTGLGGATRVAEVAWGEQVAVIGCGAVGLGAIQGARLAGAGRIIAVDVTRAKLDLALEVGATDLIEAGDDAAQRIRDLTGGRGADVVVEAAGRPAAFRLSVEAARAGGRIVWLGKTGVDEEVAFRWGSLMGERQIRRSSYGGARPHRDFPEMAAAYLAGDLKLDPLISRRIRLDEINDAFDALRLGEVVRTVIQFDT